MNERRGDKSIEPLQKTRDACCCMQSPQTIASFRWWTSQMPRYNLGLTAAGVLAFIAYVIVGFGFLPSQEEFEVTIFTILVQGTGYLVMMALANLCYLLGPLAEIYVKPQDPERFRRVCFDRGFKFSVSLPFSIPLLLAIRALFY